MELKGCSAWLFVQKVFGFNRTFMELKAEWKSLSASERPTF